MTTHPSTATPRPHDQGFTGYDPAVSGLREPFVIFDSGERLAAWNQAFADLHRDSHGACILRAGMTIDELSAWRLANSFFHPLHQHSLDTEPSAYKPGQGKGAIACQLRDGRWMLIERYPLANGQNIGLWIDITTLKMTEMMLRETAERLSIREAELSETQAALERTNEDLERRVEERTRELLAAHDDLLKKERLAVIGRLTATVAHELRNPMGAIRNTVYVLKQFDPSKPVDLNRPLDRIARSVERCDKIIEELLEYSRTRDLQRETVVFDSWLRDIVTEFPAPDGIAIDLALDATDVKISLDIDRLRRVIINLVENAAQALAEAPTPPASGRIVVSTRTQGSELTLQIEDNGPGIAPENLAKVFEPLFTTKRRGTGLGLPTVKQIVQQHDGDIVLESNPGEFTRAVVRLPLA